jgi:hypothetical protein
VETSALARSTNVDVRAPVSPSPGPQGPVVRVERPHWLAIYTAVLVVFDGAAMAAATLTAKISSLGVEPAELHVRSFTVPYVALTLATVPTWLVILALAGAYDLGPFGVTAGVWTRVVRAGAQLLAVVAVAYYIVHLATLGRGILAGMIPLAVALTLAGRAVAGAGLAQLRRRGHARRTALVLGSRRGVDSFLHQLDGHPAAGVSVVDVSVVGDDDRAPPGPDTAGDTANGGGASPDNADQTEVRHDLLAASGAGGDNGTPEGARQPQLLAVSDALARTRAETLIVTGGLAPGQLRDIAWTLEGTGVQLLVTPTPAELEGLRSEIRPVAGLPLLYLDR